MRDQRRGNRRDDDSDDDRKTSKGKGSKGGSGLSFLPEDAVETGLFGSGRARIKESVFADFDYGGNSKPQPVWLITYERKGEDPYEQPYSLGRDWKIGSDGEELIAKKGQTGLPKNCNAMKYLITPLCEALEAAGLTVSDYITGNPRDLEKLDVTVARVDQEKRDFREKNKNRRDDGDKVRTILTIESVGDGDGDAADDDQDDEKPKGRKGHHADEDDDDAPRKGKGSKGRDADDDDDQDDDDDDERPAKGKGKSSKADADDDDDAPPAKGKGSSKGKGSKADDADEADLDDEAGEAIVTALEAADGGPINVRKELEEAVMDALKGHPQRKAICARAIDKDFLETETSWSYDGKVIEQK